MAKRILVVLGGSGFVGSEVVRAALRSFGSQNGRHAGAAAASVSSSGETFENEDDDFVVMAVSRRGAPITSSAPGGDLRDHPCVQWVAADVTQPGAVNDVIKSAMSASGGATIVGVVHAVGVLFDATTPRGGKLNRFISQSESVPGESGTYEALNRDSVIDALGAIKDAPDCTSVPFVYMSAAEAGWPEVWGGATIENFFAPSFLKRYLCCKRAAESSIREAASAGSVLPSVLRPSLVYDTSKRSMWGMAPLFGAFFVANAIGLPFVDKPVSVQTLASAAVEMVAQPPPAGTCAFLRNAEMVQAHERLELRLASKHGREQ